MTAASISGKFMRLGLLQIFAVLSLSGCMSVPNPELKPDLPEKWRNAMITQARQSTTGWWTSLNDPVLNDTVTLALKQNLTLAQASERWTAAREIEKAVIAAYYPRLDFLAGPDILARPASEKAGAELSPQTRSTFRSKGAYIAGFDLTWELPLFGRGIGQQESAEAQINGAKADLNAAKVTIASEVVRTYGELRAAEEKIRVLDRLKTHYGRLDAFESEAERAGLRAQAEHDILNNAMSEVETMGLEARVQKEVALERLAVLCGLASPLEVWMQQKDEPWTFAHEQNPMLPMPAELIRGRPDIRHAEAMVMQASGEVGVAKAELYPKLAIEGALMFLGHIAGPKRPDRTIAFIAPSVRMPLVDWGLSRDIVNAREAKLREAVLAYREAVLLAIEDTETAFAYFNASEERLAHTEQEATRLHNSYARVGSALDTGFASRPEALKMEIQMTERELRGVDSKIAWITAFAAVNKARANIDDEIYSQQ